MCDFGAIVGGDESGLSAGEWDEAKDSFGPEPDTAVGHAHAEDREVNLEVVDDLLRAHVPHVDVPIYTPSPVQETSENNGQKI